MFTQSDLKNLYMKYRANKKNWKLIELKCKNCKRIAFYPSTKTYAKRKTKPIKEFECYGCLYINKIELWKNN